MFTDRIISGHDLFAEDCFSRSVIDIFPMGKKVITIENAHKAQEKSAPSFPVIAQRALSPFLHARVPGDCEKLNRDSKTDRPKTVGITT